MGGVTNTGYAAIVVSRHGRAWHHPWVGVARTGWRGAVRRVRSGWRPQSADDVRRGRVAVVRAGAAARRGVAVGVAVVADVAVGVRPAAEEVRHGWHLVVLL